MGLCQVEDCTEEAAFNLYKTYPDGKIWLNVCRSCEKKIGDENMERAGGRYKRENEDI